MDDESADRVHGQIRWDNVAGAGALAVVVALIALWPRLGAHRLQLPGAGAVTVPLSPPPAVSARAKRAPERAPALRRRPPARPKRARQRPRRHRVAALVHVAPAPAPARRIAPHAPAGAATGEFTASWGG